MRPDGMRQADTPVMDRLVLSGVHTLAARTVMPSITLPCLASLFLSVDPAEHGVTTNTWAPRASTIPGLMEVLRQGGRSTASFYNWEELRDVSRPGSVRASFFLDNCEAENGTGDRALASLAANWLSVNDVDFVFIYLGYVDTAGHAYGWMSDAYLRAIATADQCIGQVLDVLPASVHVVIASDHGGHGHVHGTDCDQDTTIPLICTGPRVPTGEAISEPASILDIAPTIAHLVGVDIPSGWQGKPVLPRGAAPTEPITFNNITTQEDNG
jgi:predicted AlkP superfamily pyrophosphatase or phosphodiesterase